MYLGSGKAVACRGNLTTGGPLWRGLHIMFTGFSCHYIHSAFCGKGRVTDSVIEEEMQGGEDPCAPLHPYHKGTLAVVPAF